MVIGLGNDITECARIQQILEKHGPLFLDHFLTPREKEESAGRLSYYAGRWAAKEAIAKAIGVAVRTVDKIREKAEAELVRMYDFAAKHR